jgi:RHS repeat-associated protein
MKVLKKILKMENMKNFDFGSKSKWQYARLLLTVLVFVTGLSAYAQTTVTLSASADAFIDQASSTTNFGTTNYLQTYPWTSSYTKRSLIQFDLSGIPAGATIISADLYLYNYGTSGYTRTLAVHRVTSSWTETGVTWNNFNGAFNGTSTATCQVSWPSNVNGLWDVKNDVQAVANGTNSNYGWLLKDNSEDGSQNFWQFNSKEFATSSVRPKLVVVYSAPLTITVSPSSASICSGGSVSLTASGGTTYSWSPSTGLNTTTGATVVANPTSTTTYTVTGTSGSNTGTKTVVVTVNTPPSVTVSPSTAAICSGSNIQLAASGAVSYSWSPSTGLSASNISNPTASPSSTTTYTVTGTASNGCTATATRQVTVNSNPTATVSNTQKPTSSSSCDGHATVSPSGGATPYTYAWSGPNSYSSTQQSPTNLCGGNYTIVVTDANGCSETKHDTVVACNAISYTVQKNEPCYGASNGSISLLGFSGNNGGNTGGSLVCPGTLYTCEQGDLLTNVGTNIVVNAGEVKRFWGSFNGTITINGGTLITCGSVWATSLNITNGGSLIANGSLTVNAPVTIPATCRIVNNNGSVAFYHPVTVDGTLFNLYGSMTLYSTLTNNSNKVYNNSTMSVNGSSFSDNYDESQLTACENGGNNNNNNNNSNNTCSITWTGTSQTGAVLTNLSAGTYIATITCGGCVKHDTIVLTQPSAALNLNLISTTASSASCDGKINVSANGGTPSYTYEVDHIIATPEFTALCAGSHLIKVTDSKGCIDTAFYTVDTLAPACCSGMVSVSKVNTSCGLNNGSLTLDLGQDTCSADTTTGGGNGGVLLGQDCIDQAVVPNQNCSSGCTRELSTSNNTVNTGEKICISGAYAGDVVMNGGTLVICGSAAINNLTFNSGEIYFNTSVTVAHVLNGTGSGTRNIWAHGSVWFMDGSYEGGVQNYNSVRIEDNYTVKAGQSTYSQGDFYVVGNMVNNGTAVNHAGINTNGLRIDGNLTNNGTLSNYCNLVVGGIYLENGIRNDHNSAYVSSGSGSGNGGNNQASCTVVWKTLSGTSLSTASTLNNLAPGTYVAEITCVGGCTRKDTLIISGSNPITFNDTLISATNSNCNGQIDLLNLSGGNGVYTYYIDGSVSALPFTGLCAGNHIVKVADSSGCEKTDTLTIISVASCEGFDAFLSAHSSTCLSTANASVTVNIDQGVAPFTYLWNNGATTKDIHGITAGFYTVVITDSIGCEITKSKAVDPGSPCDSNFCANAPQVVINSSDLNLCPQQGCAGEVAFAVNGGIGSKTYYWNGNATASLSFDSLCAGSNLFRVVDSLGCYAQSTVVVTDTCGVDNICAQKNLSLSFTGNNSSCLTIADGEITVSITGGNADYVYQWSNGTVALSGNNSNTQTGLLPNTQYTVKVTDQDGCSVTGQHSVSFDTTCGTSCNYAININELNKENALCSSQCSGEVMLGVSTTPAQTENFTYQWQGQNTSLLNQTGLCSGTYLFTAINSDGCYNQKLVQIGQEGSVCDSLCQTYSVVLDSIKNGDCNGDGAMYVNISSGVSPYKVYVDGVYSYTTTSTAISLANLSSGNHNIEVKDAQGCTRTVSGSVGGEGSPLQIILIAKSNSNCTTNNTGSLQIQTVGGSGNLSVLWSNSSTSESITGLTAGNYTVTLTDNETGCQISKTYHIGGGSESIKAALTVLSAVSSTNCNGAAVVNVLSGTAPYTYTWASSASHGPSILNACAGTYSVTVTDAGGCDTTISVVIPIGPRCNPNATAEIGGESCVGGDGYVHLTLSDTTSESGCTVSWSNSTTGTELNNVSAGTYVATITCAGSCVKTHSFVVPLQAPLSITTTQASPVLCYGANGGSIDISVSGGTSPYTYAWTGTGVNATAQDQTGLTPGSYSLTVTDSRGCTAQKTFTILSNPAITLTTSSTPTCEDKSFGSVAAVAAGGSGALTYSYQWSNEDTIVISTNQNANQLPVGTYTVLVTDQNGCSTTATATVVEDANMNCVEGCENFVAVGEATGVSCSGAADATAYISISGGSGDYSIDWQGDGPTGLSAGTYQAIVTDNVLECSIPVNYTVATSTNTCPKVCDITAILTAIDATCVGADNGALSLEVNNSADYHITWTKAGATDTLHEQAGTGDGGDYELQNVTAGKYIVTIKDNEAGSCFYTTQVNVFEPQILKAYNSVRDLCPGESTVLNTNGGSSAVWTKNGTQIGTGNSLTVTEPGVYVVALAGVCAQTDTTIIKEDKECPIGKVLCCPTKLPTIQVKDTCTGQLVAIAMQNAKYQYTQYIDEKKKEFQRAYIAKCLSAEEEFTVSFEDKEHHYTLYYYDQANNLVRTVSPKGVKLITNTDKLNKIKQDRSKGNQTVFTEHTLVTTYEYNSLNQLTGQLLPDHDAMDIQSKDESKYTSGLDPNLTVTGVQFDGIGNGFLTAYDASGKGVLYRTTDRGDNWTKQTQLGITSLKTVQITDDGTAAYAAGDNGLFVKSVDAGENWTAVPVGTLKNIIAINFSTNTAGVLFAADGSKWQTSDGGENWNEITSISGLGSSTISSISFESNHTTGYMTVNSTSGVGTVYKTVDGGDTWTKKLDDNLTTTDLKKVYFVDNNTAYAVGIDGRLLKSTNGGLHWSAVATSVSASISDIFFRSDVGNTEKGIGFIGGDLYRTYDGGKTWQQTTITPSSNGNLVAHSIKRSDNSGYIISEKKLFKTTNGGLSFTALNGPTLTSGVTYVSVDQAEGNMNTVLVITSNNKVYRSIDAGASWVDISAGNSVTAAVVTGSSKALITLSNGDIYSTNNLTAITPTWTSSLSDANNYTSFDVRKDGSTLYVYALDKTTRGISLSDNNGASWTTNSVNSSVVNTLADVSAAPSGLLLALGANGQMGYSSDNGANWSSVAQELSPLALYGVSSASGNTVCAAGLDGTILKSIDGGDNWVQQVSATSETLKDIKALSATTVKTGGTNGVILSTTDGSSWTNVSVSGVTSDFNSLSTNGSQTLLVGNSGKVVSDFGGSMASMTTPLSSNLYGSAIYNNSYALSVGAGGVILKYNSTDGWVNKTDMQALVLFATDMLDESTGYAVGKNGTVVKTNDAGYHWINQNAATTKNLNAVDFIDDNTGVIVGNSGIILKTTNGGATYTAQTIGSTNFKDVQMVTSTLGFAVGTGGVVLKTTNGGTSWSTELNLGVDVNSVYFVDETTGYVTGANGLLYKAVQTSGTSYIWTDEHDIISISNSYNDVYFVDYQTGYVVGTGGKVYKTINGADTWTLETGLSSTNTLNFIAAIDRNNFYVGGAGSTVSFINDQADMYSVKMYYDELGRVIAKQDARQFPINAFSYTVYDEFNRIVEAGEISNTTSISTKANFSISSQVKYSDFIAWLQTGSKHQISRTQYDIATKDWSTTQYSTFEQENLRPRVASTFYIDGNVNGSADITTVAYDFAAHYSYDEHGNVETLINEKTALKDLKEDFKRVDYSYDLVTGIVNQVAYQKGDKDQFFHKYVYDEDNRLVDAFTSTDGVIWDKDASQQYYRHSVVKRTVIGEEQVQGQDYVYTIQGWLKGVNSETLNKTRDIGSDGGTQTAKDVYGFSLKYFAGDYKAINHSNDATHFLAKEDAMYATQNTKYFNGNTNPAYEGLYNGNISAMVTAIEPFMQGAEGPQAMLYKYDQLNRIVHSTAYEATGIKTSNDWLGLTAKADYEENYTYDANGNILTLTRKGDQNKSMDNFAYHYEEISEGFDKNSNRLSYVTDNVNSANYADDIDNQSAGNYDYDGIGNLIKDVSEQIANIEWHVNSKVKKVTRTSTSTKSDLEFQYDAMGNRVVKIEKPRSGSGVKSEDNWIYTYYERDASGNTMAIYNKTYDKVTSSKYKEKLKISEQDIYGSKRLGLYVRTDNEVSVREFTSSMSSGLFGAKTQVNAATNPQADNTNFLHERGAKSYELVNHLGNILVVVSDRVIASTSDGLNIDEFNADLISANDYYPFGASMVGRTISSSLYRYGFNGKEKDKENTSGTYDFGARILEVRLGRWLSMDPWARKYPDVSPYVFSLNNPILLTDKGGDTVTVTVGAIPVGTTLINLYSGPEIKADATLKGKTIEVNVYEVTVTNESGSSATFYYTRVSYRGDAADPSAEPTERTFDVVKDGDKFLGKIKERWGVTDYVLEVRALDDINNQTIHGKKGKVEKDRTAIQFHVKGASDGCLLAVGKDQFQTKVEGTTIVETDLKSASKETQLAFMAKVKEFKQQDVDAGKGDVIVIQFDQLYKDETQTTSTTTSTTTTTTSTDGTSTGTTTTTTGTGTTGGTSTGGSTTEEIKTCTPEEEN